MITARFCVIGKECEKEISDVDNSLPTMVMPLLCTGLPLSSTGNSWQARAKGNCLFPRPSSLDSCLGELLSINNSRDAAHGIALHAHLIARVSRRPHSASFAVAANASRLPDACPHAHNARRPVTQARPLAAGACFGLA